MSDHQAEMQLLNNVLRGRIHRRDIVKRGAALGLGAAALGSLMNVAGVAAQDGGPNGEITWGLDVNVPNIIPFGGIALAQWLGKEFMYDSLLAWDADLNVIPALAESWDTPDDTTYVFSLRQGVTFHDGGEMTAKDVVYSMSMARDPVEPGVKVPYVDNLTSVEAIDDYTVIFTMTKARSDIARHARVDELHADRAGGTAGSRRGAERRYRHRSVPSRRIQPGQPDRLRGLS